MAAHRRNRQPVRTLVCVLGLGLVGNACDVRPNAPKGGDCPPCECNCGAEAAKPGPAATDPQTAPVAGPAIAVGPIVDANDVHPEWAEHAAAASRKMMHGDGAGCLAELDALASKNPQAEARLAAIRGQCEMLVGRCQQGKQRLAAYYQAETNMHPDRAVITAEQIGAMRCRGGDSTERDELLRAYYELTDGAYMTKKSPADCRKALETAEKLIPRVPQLTPDDSQISGGAQALFHTAASCFARAGDCNAAWATYNKHFPRPKGIDAAALEQSIREAYDSSVLFCGASHRGPSTRPTPSK